MFLLVTPIISQLCLSVAGVFVVTALLQDSLDLLAFLSLFPFLHMFQVFCEIVCGVGLNDHALRVVVL